MAGIIHPVAIGEVAISISTPLSGLQDHALYMTLTIAFASPPPSAQALMDPLATMLHAYAATQDVPQQVDIIAIALTINAL